MESIFPASGYRSCFCAFRISKIGFAKVESKTGREPFFLVSQTGIMGVVIKDTEAGKANEEKL
jgi:hypothetical protein